MDKDIVTVGFREMELPQDVVDALQTVVNTANGNGASEFDEVMLNGAVIGIAVLLESQGRDKDSTLVLTGKVRRKSSKGAEHATH
ncbi:MAG: hypothetical protein AB2758_20650 [Candidatus Thiodiazotropha endolucinida]